MTNIEYSTIEATEADFIVTLWFVFEDLSQYLLGGINYDCEAWFISVSWSISSFVNNVFLTEYTSTLHHLLTHFTPTNTDSMVELVKRPVIFHSDQQHLFSLSQLFDKFSLFVW